MIAKFIVVLHGFIHGMGSGRNAASGLEASPLEGVSVLSGPHPLIPSNESGIPLRATDWADHPLHAGAGLREVERPWSANMLFISLHSIVI